MQSVLVANMYRSLLDAFAFLTVLLLALVIRSRRSYGILGSRPPLTNQSSYLSKIPLYRYIVQTMIVWVGALLRVSFTTLHFMNG